MNSEVNRKNEELRCKKCHRFEIACECIDWKSYLDAIHKVYLCIQQSCYVDACFTLGKLYQEIKTKVD